MDIRPLTKEQHRFAEENHDLVYSFLNAKNLPESSFYDVVIFGYLRAAQEYCEVPSLHRYKFSTLAWKRTVSYTHLDVYKRQLWNISIGLLKLTAPK